MYVMRRWGTRNAGALAALFRFLDPLIRAFHPLFRRLGYGRLERPAAALEARLKGVLFDCRMCGRCILRATGMTCPMNCPKALRNGPCGGVRADGTCEVAPETPCVWVEAWAGSRRMRDGEAILTVQAPVDHDIQGSSAWLRHIREAAAARGARAEQSG